MSLIIGEKTEVQRKWSNCSRPHSSQSWLHPDRWTPEPLLFYFIAFIEKHAASQAEFEHNL